MDASRLAEFNRECQLNDYVLRHLPLKIDPRLADTLVAVARGEAIPQAEGEEEPQAAEGETKEAAKGETKETVESEAKETAQPAASNA